MYKRERKSEYNLAPPFVKNELRLRLLHGAFCSKMRQQIFHSSSDGKFNLFAADADIASSKHVYTSVFN
jgi:hypothetical protein